MKKRMIGWALTLGMIMSLLPVGAMAASKLSAPTDIYWGTEPSIDSDTGKPYTIPYYDPDERVLKDVPILDPVTGLFSVNPLTGKPYVEAVPPVPSVRIYRRGTPGVIYYSIPDAGQPSEPDWQGVICARLYKTDANGENRVEVANRSLNYSPLNDNGGYPYTDNLFGANADSLSTGYYVMGLTCVGDNQNYLDSDEAFSKVWHYIRPSAALSQVPASSLSWDWPKAKWSKIPEDTENFEDDGVYQYEVEWYRQDTAASTSKNWVGGIYPAENETAIDNKQINSGGVGFYSFRVRALSRDLTQWTDGPWSEYSPLYDLTQTHVDLEGMLDILDNKGSPTGADICSAIQSVDTRDLKDTMLTHVREDGGIVGRLADMEEKITGAPTPVVLGAGAPTELQNGVSVLGAQFNTAGSGGVQLEIDAPQKQDLTIPKEYNHSLAIKFSMTAQGGGIDSSALKVPVQITLPIPANIKPEFLWILHYPADGGEPEAVKPYIFAKKDDKWYASIVLDHFSDFVMTALTKDIPGSGSTVDPDKPTTNPEPPVPTQTPDVPTGGGSTGSGGDNTTGGNTTGGGSTGGGTTGGNTTGSSSSGKSSGGSSSRPDTSALVKGNLPSGEVQPGYRLTLKTKGSGVSIRYTTDGTEPTLKSAQYYTPIAIDRDMTVKVAAVKGNVLGDVVTYNYTMGTPVAVYRPQPRPGTFQVNAASTRYLRGYKDGTFRPDQAATRYEVVEALSYLVVTEKGEEPLPFTDVDADHVETVSRLVGSGLINGMTANTFQGSGPMTRCQLCKVLTLALELQPGGGSTAFSDVQGHWALPYISALAGAGYIQGYSDGTFRPDQPVTRAELATLLNRVVGRRGVASISFTYSDVPADFWGYLEILNAARR